MTTTPSCIGIKPLRPGCILALLLAGLSSQGYAENALRVDAPRQVGFRKDIRPILDTYCVFCHFDASPHGHLVLQGKLTRWMLIERPSVKSKFPGVTPGKPDESFVIHKLEGTHPGIGLTMPTTLPLDKEQIGLIRQWIADGAADN